MSVLSKEVKQPFEETANVYPQVQEPPPAPTPAPVSPPRDAVKEARDADFQARLKAEQELASLKQRVEAQEQAQQAQRNKDKDSLIKSWQEKCANLESEIKKRDTDVLNSRLDGMVSELAAKINPEVPELFKPMIKERIKATVNPDGQVSVYCLDKAGNPIASTPDEVAQEIIDNDRYKRYVVANRASGSADVSSAINQQAFQQAPQQPAPAQTQVGDDEVDLATTGNDNLVRILKSRFVRKGV